MRVGHSRSRMADSPHCTVSVMEPEAPLEVAVIVVCPAATRVANPVLLPMVATPVLEELQVGVTALLFVSVAVNVSEPELSRAVNVPVPCPEMQPVQLIVNPLLL